MLRTERTSMFAAGITASPQRRSLATTRAEDRSTSGSTVKVTGSYSPSEANVASLGFSSSARGTVWG